METLFRLVLKRPAIVQDENTPSIILSQNTPFQAALAQAHQSRNPREALKAAARQFIASQDFTGDPAILPIAGKLSALSLELSTLEKKDNVSNQDVSDAINRSFGKSPRQLIADGNLDTAFTTLRDSIIAIKQLPEEHRRQIEQLTRQLRDLEVIKNVVDFQQFPGRGSELRRFRRRSVKLPTEAELRSSLSTLEKQKELEEKRKEEEKRKREEGDAKLDIYKRLTTAIQELTRLDSDHHKSTPQRENPGFQVPQQFRPTQLLISELSEHQEVSKLNVQRFKMAIERRENVERIQKATPETLQTDVTLTRPLSLMFLSGKAPFTPAVYEEIAFMLKPESENALSASTRELLKERNLNISKIPLDTIVEKLQAEVTRLSYELDNLLGRPVQRSFKRVGNTMVMTSKPMASLWNNLVVGGDLTLYGLTLPEDLSIPDTHGDIAPAGVADLLVVKQQLVRYEGADIAHIENILKGEKKEREHTTRKQTEEFNLRETETTTSEERELESTTRFEMSRESSQTIKEDATLKAGLSVSGKYGPTVEFAASVEGSVSRSKEEATKSAASFSQDVTERSVNKLTERVLERTTLRITNEVIDKNMHGFDNVLGTAHVAGVYQWVNKVYQAQMMNYGIRMMYDFMVPEPAAFLISSLTSAHANAVELVKPADFTLRPDQITESNYFTWVKQYNATDIQPPPEYYKTKSLDFKAGGGEEGTDYNHSGQIAIEEGYKAVHGTICSLKNIWDNSATVDVALGTRTHRFPIGDWVWSTALSEETDSIPFAMDTLKVSTVEVAVEVKCQRTDRALLKWKLETHAKLTTAYKARLSEYEEKIAALEIQAGVAIRGRNPFLNLELIKDELKKHCITIMTEQHFDLFNSIQTGAYNVPQINISENELEGPYVRFFEQAFEWEQMTWLTYPYFWGRKSTWSERIAYEDVDPEFNQFLKAGYCRVVVPVRPGFEGALDHFMTYGEPWNGGPLPAISNPLYLPIADEIAERLDRPGEEIPQGDPWLVRVPTTLVHLRPDDKLPRWKQDATGEWVEE